MKKKLFLIISLLFIFFPTVVHADMGPKPSVHVNIYGLTDKCYVTLLSKEKASGPFGIYDGTEDSKRFYEEYGPTNVWQAFVDYEDSDGYYFLQYFQNAYNGKFSWNYYPPDEFKILLYFPENHQFIISEQSIKRYAFESYYKMTLNSDQSINIQDTSIQTVEEVYGFAWFNKDLGGRILFTVIIEVIIAFLYHIRKAGYVTTIIGMNVLTQVFLNFIVNTVHMEQTGTLFIAYYLGIETLITLIEGFIYLRVFKEDIAKNKIITYVILANVASFIIGLLMYM